MEDQQKMKGASAQSSTQSTQTKTGFTDLTRRTRVQVLAGEFFSVINASIMLSRLVMGLSQKDATPALCAILCAVGVCVCMSICILDSWCFMIYLSLQINQSKHHFKNNNSQ